MLGARTADRRPARLRRFGHTSAPIRGRCPRRRRVFPFVRRLRPLSGLKRRWQHTSAPQPDHSRSSPRDPLRRRTPTSSARCSVRPGPPGPRRPGPEPAPYAPILKAVEKARKDLRQRKAGAVYAKLLRELDAPHVLLRAPRRNSTPTTKATLTSTPGRSAALCDAAGARPTCPRFS